MTRGNGRAAAAIALVVALSGGVTGCVLQHGSCRDAVPLESTADRLAAAALVVDADVRATGRSVGVDGSYRLLTATVTDEVKGTAPSRALAVFSPLTNPVLVARCHRTGFVNRAEASAVSAPPPTAAWTRRPRG